jgi:hypothetical protein
VTAKPCPGCFERTHVLTDTEGRERRLSTVDSPTGIWVLEPDGRTTRKITPAELHRGNHGHPLHACTAPPAQASLFEAS